MSTATLARRVALVRELIPLQRAAIVGRDRLIANPTLGRVAREAAEVDRARIAASLRANVAALARMERQLEATPTGEQARG